MIEKIIILFYGERKSAQQGGRWGCTVEVKFSKRCGQNYHVSTIKQSNGVCLNLCAPIMFPKHDGRINNRALRVRQHLALQKTFEENLGNRFHVSWVQQNSYSIVCMAPVLILVFIANPNRQSGGLKKSPSDRFPLFALKINGFLFQGKQPGCTTDTRGGAVSSFSPQICVSRSSKDAFISITAITLHAIYTTHFPLPPFPDLENWKARRAHAAIIIRNERSEEGRKCNKYC